MERTRLDVGELYGYAVCLLAIVTFLVASAELVDGVLDLREPPYTTSYREGPSLVTLESYRLDLLDRAEPRDSAVAAAASLPPDSTLQRMFERERLYRLAVSHQTSRKTIVVNLVLQVLALGLFTSHWIWLRRRERSARVPEA